jgi:hypothetical protein
MASRALRALSRVVADLGGPIGYGLLVVVGVAAMVALIVGAVILVLRVISLGPS